MRQVAGLRPGLYEVLIKPQRRTRSLDANRYYFVALVQPFVEWLREEYGDPHITTDQAHEMLKVKILGLQHGVLVPRTKTLDSKAFAEYVDCAAQWLQEFCDITVIPSEVFYETKG